MNGDESGVDSSEYGMGLLFVWIVLEHWLSLLVGSVRSYQNKVLVCLLHCGFEIFTD